MRKIFSNFVCFSESPNFNQISFAASSKLAKSCYVMLINHVEYPILLGLSNERVAEGKGFDLHNFSCMYIMQFSPPFPDSDSNN